MSAATRPGIPSADFCAMFFAVSSRGHTRMRRAATPSGAAVGESPTVCVCAGTRPNVIGGERATLSADRYEKG